MGKRPGVLGRVARRYWKLLRIKISLAFFFPMALGFAVAAKYGEPFPWYDVPLAFAAFFCASFFSSTLNFYADVDSDRRFEGRFKDMDLKQQPFVTGEMGRVETAAAFAVSGAGCVVLSLLVSLRCSIYVVGFALVVGVIYSHPWFRLKARPVTDLLCNVAGMGLSLMAGLSLGGGYRPPVAFLAWGALFITVVYIPTVANDVPFDEAAGYRTSGVYFGAQRLLWSMVPLTLAMVPFAVVVALDTEAPWLFRVATAAGTPLAIAGASVVLYLWHPPRIELNPDLVLFPMYLVIIFFIVYGVAVMA
ncbi:MAG: UbiA prenyltransferase family protein [Actinomycetota bacterium]